MRLVGARHWKVWLPVLLFNVILVAAVSFYLQGKPFGWFHRADLSQLRLRDAQERDAAENALKQGISTKSFNDSACVFILTARRKYVSGYLVRAVTTLHRHLGVHRPRIFIYNADPEAGKLRPVADADRAEIQQGFTVIRPDFFPLDENTHHRESYHYGQILRHATARACSWSVVMEDDVKVTSDFMPKLMSLLQEVKKSCSVGFIKLFDVDSMKGWSSEFVDVALMLLISVGTATAVSRFAKAMYGRRLLKLPRAVLHFLFLQWAVTVILLLGIVGKQRIEWAFKSRGLREVGRWGDYVGGTQGTVFPNCTVGVFAEYLLANWEGKGSSIDNAVDQLLPKAAREKGLVMYSTSPNLVQHIGLFSTHSPDQTHISPISSLSFEER